MDKRKLLIIVISILSVLSFSCCRYSSVNIKTISLENNRIIYLIDCGNVRLKAPLYINVTFIDSKKMISNNTGLIVERYRENMIISMPIDTNEMKKNKEVEIYMSFGAVTIESYVVVENKNDKISFTITKQNLSHRF